MKLLNTAELYRLKTLIKQQAELDWQLSVQRGVMNTALKAGDGDVAVAAYATSEILDGMREHLSVVWGHNYTRLMDTHKSSERITPTILQAKAELKAEAEAEDKLDKGWGAYVR